MISSKPMGKLQYIGVKAASNLIVLVVMEFVLLLALMALQLLYGESTALQPLGYLWPFLAVTFPYLTICAAIAILFDVVPFLRGVFGNVIIFFLWAIIITLSMENPQVAFLDLMGMTRTSEFLLASIAAQYPQVAPENFGIGYQQVLPDRPAAAIPLFQADAAFLLSRLAWIGIAICIVLLSAVIFDRFRTRTRLSAGSAEPREEESQPTLATVSYEDLSPVRHSRLTFLRMLRGEMKIMLSGYNIWARLTFIGVATMCAFAPESGGYKWHALFLLFAYPIWSQMGSRERHDFTGELIAYRCPGITKWLVTCVSGILVTGVLLSGFIAHFAMLGAWDHVAALLAGAVFIPSLSLCLGTLSGSRRPFEGLFTVLFYIGPLQNVPGMDFLGISQPNTALYLVFSAVLIFTGAMVTVLRDRKILKAA